MAKPSPLTSWTSPLSFHRQMLFLSSAMVYWRCNVWFCSMLVSNWIRFPSVSEIFPLSLDTAQAHSEIDLTHVVHIWRGVRFINAALLFFYKRAFTDCTKNVTLSKLIKRMHHAKLSFANFWHWILWCWYQTGFLLMTFPWIPHLCRSNCITTTSTYLCWKLSLSFGLQLGLHQSC